MRFLIWVVFFWLFVGLLMVGSIFMALYDPQSQIPDSGKIFLKLAILFVSISFSFLLCAISTILLNILDELKKANKSSDTGSGADGGD
jgi:hypothetical protein